MISDEDCLREGIYYDDKNGRVVGWPFGVPFYYTFKGCVSKKTGKQLFYSQPRDAFSALIDKVSGKGTWESNPFVLAYELKLVK